MRLERWEEEERTHFLLVDGSRQIDLVEYDGGQTSVSLNQDGLRFTGGCPSPLRAEYDGARWRLRGAVLYSTQEACAAEAASFEHTCRGGACTHNPDVLELGECEQVLSELDARVAWVEASSTRDRERSWRRLRRAQRTVWTVEENACVRTHLERRGRTYTLVRTLRNRDATRTTSLSFEPRPFLQHAEAFRGRSTIRTHSTGMEGVGLFAPQRTPFYLVSGAFLLGGERVFFERTNCEARL